MRDTVQFCWESNCHFHLFGYNYKYFTSHFRHKFHLPFNLEVSKKPGYLALISQQCFISDLGISAYIVEPFLDNSVLYHTDLKTTQELHNGIFGNWTSQRINVIIFRH